MDPHRTWSGTSFAPPPQMADWQDVRSGMAVLVTCVKAGWICLVQVHETMSVHLTAAVHEVVDRLCCGCRLDGIVAQSLELEA